MARTALLHAVRDRRRWMAGSIALILGLASVAAVTHRGPWTASSASVAESVR
jgi:hypothetical protein